MASPLLATARYLDDRLHARCFGVKAPQHDVLRRGLQARAPALQKVGKTCQGARPKGAAELGEMLDGIKAPIQLPVGQVASNQGDGE